MPRAGDQLSSLTPTNTAFDPEKFKNLEIGAKWDIRPNLSATAAIYRLDRTNVVVTDPADATRSILVDGQRSKGVELGLGGNVTPQWNVMGGYAYQDAKLTAAHIGDDPGRHHAGAGADPFAVAVEPLRLHADVRRRPGRGRIATASSPRPRTR